MVLKFIMCMNLCPTYARICIIHGTVHLTVQHAAGVLLCVFDPCCNLGHGRLANSQPSSCHTLHAHELETKTPIVPKVLSQITVGADDHETTYGSQPLVHVRRPYQPCRALTSLHRKNSA